MYTLYRLIHASHSFGVKNLVTRERNCHHHLTYRTEQNRTCTLFTQGLCIQTCEDMIQIQNDDMVDYLLA